MGLLWAEGRIKSGADAPPSTPGPMVACRAGGWQWSRGGSRIAGSPRFDYGRNPHEPVERPRPWARSASGPSREEIPLNWNHWIRQIHRWLSIVFTVTVIANFVLLARGKGVTWVTYSPLL